MLNKRTQILFDEQTWKYLAKLAIQRNDSIGNLVRKAVQKEYLPTTDLEQRHKTIEAILKIKEEYQKKHPYQTKKKESVVAMIRRMRDERTKHLLRVIEGHRKSHESNT